jgi:serine/alanine adding enzyme
MTRKIETGVLEKKDQASWDDYVLKKKESSIFHLYIWNEVLSQSFSYKPFYIYAKEENGRIAGVMPLFFINSRLTGKRLVSLPFSYICGPLADSEEISQALISNCLEIFKETKSKYLEIKLNREDKTLENFDFKKSQSYRTFILELKEPESLWKNLHKSSTQRGIQKAKKEGVTIEFAQEEKELKKFHRLNAMTCQQHGIPCQPLFFFENLWRLMFPQNLVKLGLAQYKGKTVAGSFFFLFKEKVYYMYGASDQNYLFCRPNHLLLWETINWATENNFSFFDLGRVSQENTGLAEFKRRWGAQESSLFYYYLPEVKGVGATNRESRKFKLITQIWKKLPLWLTEKGSFLYKHLG